MMPPAADRLVVSAVHSGGVLDFVACPVTDAMMEGNTIHPPEGTDKYVEESPAADKPKESAAEEPQADTPEEAAVEVPSAETAVEAPQAEKAVDAEATVVGELESDQAEESSVPDAKLVGEDRLVLNATESLPWLTGSELLASSSGL